MGIFSQKVPPLPPPPLAATSPTFGDKSVGLSAARQLEASRKAAKAGFSDTLKNTGGAQGLTTKASDKATKSLLG